MGTIIPFPGNDLEAQIAMVRAAIRELDREEPEDMMSEAYDDWADRHEELEDQLEDLLDLLEEQE